MNEALEMWVIYDHPKDYPNSFIARRWLVDDKGERFTGDIINANSLEKLRIVLINIGKTCINRDPNDDPVIVETWL